MIHGIDDPSNKGKIAVVAVGYNRIRALERLLNSLNGAEYPNNEIPLVISIDASGETALYSFVESFEWKHGKKYVNIQKERLGLKNHIFQCFSLTRYFKGIILLEDDLFVSPYFYHYAEATLEKYGEDKTVAGVALYANETNGYKDIPFQPEYSGSDVFAMQAVCSWGEMLNERMWDDFSAWMESWDGDFDKIDMNSTIKGWSRAWSKYMYAYMVQTNRYFIYPYMPVTTNFNDAGGEHGGGDASLVQVSLLQGKRNYQLSDFCDLVCYDIYLHNKAIAKWLGLDENELQIDYYGQRDVYNKRYILTPFPLHHKKVRGFRHAMRPWELNIKYGLEGSDIILYDRGEMMPEPTKNHRYSYNYLMYYLQRYKNNISLGLLVKDYWNRLKNKIR